MAKPETQQEKSRRLSRERTARVLLATEEFLDSLDEVMTIVSPTHPLHERKHHDEVPGVAVSDQDQLGDQ